MFDTAIASVMATWQNVFRAIQLAQGTRKRTRALTQRRQSRAPSWRRARTTCRRHCGSFLKRLCALLRRVPRRNCPLRMRMYNRYAVTFLCFSLVYKGRCCLCVSFSGTCRDFVRISVSSHRPGTMDNTADHSVESHSCSRVRPAIVYEGLTGRVR